MKTIVYHSGALGDFLAILPFISFWRTRDPGGIVILVGKKAYAELIEPVGLFDEVWDVGGTAMLGLFSTRLTGPLADELSTFDAAILFAPDHSSVIGNMRHAGIGQIYCHSPFPKERIHIVDYHLGFLGHAQFDAVSPFILPLNHGTHYGEKADQLRAGRCNPVFIHPGSGSKRKNWPFGRFLSLAGQFRQQGLDVIWLGGEAEEEISCPTSDLILRHKPLPVLALLLGGARLYVGNDSGITHLAAAVGCPTVALFGPSDRVVWAPRGRRVTIMYTPTDCAPCHPGNIPDNQCRQECLTRLTMEKILAVCLECIS